MSNKGKFFTDAILYAITAILSGVGYELAKARGDRFRGLAVSRMRSDKLGEVTVIGELAPDTSAKNVRPGDEIQMDILAIIATPELLEGLVSLEPQEGVAAELEDAAAYAASEWQRGRLEHFLFRDLAQRPPDDSAGRPKDGPVFGRRAGNSNLLN